MNKLKLFTLCVISATVISSCGDDTSKLQGNSNGAIEIVGSDFLAGSTLTTSLSDPDGIVDGTVSYLWSTGATGSSYTITEDDEGTVITASALYTDKAGFMEGVGASTPLIRPTLNVTANVVKGPVSGASCDLFSIDDSGAAGSTSEASAMSDATGAVTFIDVHYEGTALISCTGGTYLDESTGNTVDAPELRAVLNVVEGDAETPAPSYVVSPLTEMAVQAAGANLNDFAAVADTINQRFGIRFDATEVQPTVVGVDVLGADGAENSDRYGSVLALLSQLDSDDADKDIAAVIAELAADIADGSFADATLDAFELAQTNLQTTSQVASYVDESLLDVIGSAVGYNNDPVTAIIEGVFSGTVPHTATSPLTGAVSVTDPNFEEDAIIIQSDVALDFGSFSIAADGSWSYTVDVANETVASLELGESVNDLVTITSIDGTTAEINIRVASLTQVVKLSDIGGDTGEIYYNLDNLRQGKLTASFAKEEARGSDGNIKDAYIALYGSSGSNSESLVDVRIQGNQIIDDVAVEPRFFVRNTDSAAYPGNIITAPFVEEQFYEISIAWDLDAVEQLTITVDGEVIGGGAFSTAAVVDSDYENLAQWFADGVQRVQFRFGDNDRTIPFGSFYVDNIAVYSDTAGTVSVFEDDFESYAEGDTLDGDNSPYGTAIYAEVVVFDVGGAAEPTPAVFFGLTGAIAGDEATSTGAVSVLDPDDGEAFIQPASLTGMYGTLDILDDGSWTYTLDTNNATIAALVVGERETDTFTIESFDGTTAELAITITGTVVVNTGANNVAVIVDTLDSDTGELRYALGDNGPLAAGRIEVKVKRLDDDLGNADAFITLFNENTNNDGAILDLRLRDDSFGVRSPGDVDTSAATMVLDTFMDVVITWEYPGGDTTVNPLVTVEVDGVSFNAEGFTPDNNSFGGVTHVSFRLGGNSAVSEATGKFTLDDLSIFSDTAGTTVVFSDDFENYADGDSLDTDNAASPYHSNTSEATIEKIGSVGGPGTAGNKFAVITDTLDSDTGELRYALGDNGPLAAGRIEVAIKRLDDDLGNADAFISLFNENTNNDGAILDLRIRDDSFGVRSPGDLDTSAALVMLDQFMNVVITWEYPGGDTTVNPLVTVEIDGVSFIAEGFTPDNNSFGGVTHVSFRLGGNSAVSGATGKFSLDNLFIFSDTAGTTEVFSDDFEAYADGDSLDTDNAVSPYHSNTSEAVVGVEEGGAIGGPGSAGNKAAAITDTLDSDTGELRYALGDGGPLVAGRFEVAIKRLDDDLGDGDAFISLFNENTNNDGAILDLRIRDDSFGVRSPSDIDTSAALVMLDQFMNVVVTWEYPEGNLEVTPLVTVEIDGVSFVTEGFTPDNNSVGGVTHASIRFGDNGGVRETTGVITVDNIAIYSDTAGNALVFSDDFETYVDGDSLDTDNPVSPYNSSTSEAVVIVE
ncbi:VCBS domain-containing protein [Paraglaciecola aquimarina]|uniref:VCBS domain-containing protein n=1 Tax=Paraglaciecola algarum TaxID=3050085 RepID=A0ABS9D3K6_9ALTE|nr:VCBS domain-containing protein [Paraglaciecola sp. G1-23]MCF2947518.1 VCBS domain-containing protein [Paraglaciecola sp. G1-23]